MIMLDKAQDKSRAYYGLAFLVIVVFPMLIVSVGSIPSWLSRAIALFILMDLGAGAILWFGLSPRSQVIDRSAKLNEPRFAAVRTRIEIGLRVAIVLFGMLFLISRTVPFTLDLLGLIKGESPEKIVGVVRGNSVALGGIWFLKQGIRLTRAPDSYSLFYSWRFVRTGESYEFTVLPRSRLILDFEERR